MTEIERTDQEKHLLSLAAEAARHHNEGMSYNEYQAWSKAAMGEKASPAYKEALLAVGRGEFDVSLLAGGVPASWIMGLHPDERAKLAPGRRLQVRTRDHDYHDWPYLTWREMTEEQRRRLFPENMRYSKDYPRKNNAALLRAHDQHMPTHGPDKIFSYTFGSRVRMRSGHVLWLGEKSAGKRGEEYELDLITTRAKLRKDGSLEEVIRILQEGLL